jgi:hypothetical protein
MLGAPDGSSDGALTLIVGLETDAGLLRWRKRACQRAKKFRCALDDVSERTEALRSLDARIVQIRRRLPLLLVR